MNNFILNIYKPKGITSTQVGSLLKKELGQKKIGHLGTLDPIATGVLPVFGGKYTKLIPYFEQEHKTYIANILLGADSPTLDTESKIVLDTISAFSTHQLEKVLKTFETCFLQQAPIFSALKYKGRPQYYYARNNIAIPLKKKHIEIFSLDLLDYKHPNIQIKIHCSKGCYIRSLASDIGKKLKTKAILQELERIKVGEIFTRDNIIYLDNQFKKNYYSSVLEPWNLLNNFHLISIDKTAIEKIKNGQKMKIDQNIKKEKNTFVFLEKNLVAVGLVLKDKNEFYFQPKKLLI